MEALSINYIREGRYLAIVEGSMIRSEAYTPEHLESPSNPVAWISLTERLGHLPFLPSSLSFHIGGISLLE